MYINANQYLLESLYHHTEAVRQGADVSLQSVYVEPFIMPIMADEISMQYERPLAGYCYAGKKVDVYA